MSGNGRTNGQRSRSAARPRVLVVHSVGVAIEALGLGEPGPYLDLRQVCLWCGATLCERRIDARTIGPTGIELMSEEDSDAAAAHVDKHLRENWL